jgi:hypothetical protein
VTVRHGALATALLVAVLLIGSGVTTGAARAAEPSPGPGVLDPVDPRSEGEGPGVQGTPLEILVAVVLLGLGAAAVTLLWARFTRDD